MTPKERYPACAIPLISWSGAFRNYTRVFGWVGGVLQNGAGGVHWCRRETSSCSERRGRFSEGNIPMYLEPTAMEETEARHRRGTALMPEI